MDIDNRTDSRETIIPKLVEEESKEDMVISIKEDFSLSVNKSSTNKRRKSTESDENELHIGENEKDQNISSKDIVQDTSTESLQEVSEQTNKDSEDKLNQQELSTSNSTINEADAISLSFEQEEDDIDEEDDENDHISNYGTEGDLDSRGVRDDDSPDDVEDVISDDDEQAGPETSVNDDVALIIGSSDEEEDGNHSQDISPQDENIRTSHPESVTNEEYEDMDYENADFSSDDLMNFAVMNVRQKITKKKCLKLSKRKRSPPNKQTEQKSSGKPKYDFRLDRKKRSIKWLTSISKRMHHDAASSCTLNADSYESRVNQKSSDVIEQKVKTCQIGDSILSDDSPEKLNAEMTCKEQTKLHEEKISNELFCKIDEIVKASKETEDICPTASCEANVNDDKTQEDKESNRSTISSSNCESVVELRDSDALMSSENKENSPKSENTINKTHINNGEHSETKILKDEEHALENSHHDKQKFSNNNLSYDVNEKTKETEPTGITVCKPKPKSFVENKQQSVKTNMKRQRSASLDHGVNENQPIKKIRAELETTIPIHDSIVDNYLDGIQNNSVEDVQKTLNKILNEIQTLNDMIKTKEIEWNNLLHLKKVKEEICFRLSRKKQVLQITSSNSESFNCDDKPNNVSLQINSQSKLIASTPNTTLASTNVISSSTLNSLNGTSSWNNNANKTTFDGMKAIGTTSGSNSNPGGSITQSILHNRANMKSSDLAKEKFNTQKFHRNILPKPSSSAISGGLSSANSTNAGACITDTLPTFAISSTSPATIATNSLPLSNAGSLGLLNTNPNSNLQPILNSYLTAASVQHQLGEIINGHHNAQLNSLQNSSCSTVQPLMVGRQGVIKDVKSIIADYRQRHPETVPRRGRRMKGNSLANLSSADACSILGSALKGEGKLTTSELGILLSKFEGNSRSSSNDSNKVSIASTNTTQTSTQPAYPEVTLHPVSTSQMSGEPTSGSLLHGILTKYNRPNATSTPSTTANSAQNAVIGNYTSTFSPTLARLLTAPERITGTQAANLPVVNSSQAGTSGLNLSKVVGNHSSEITITPVVNPQPSQQTLLQQHMHLQQLKEAAASAIGKERLKTEHLLNIDDEADDSIDRLVIDEGDSSYGAEEHHRIAPHAIGQEFHENEVPLCQGCKKQEAQFVCAGCGNQWYCSRDCQVKAWDEHSEVCTG